MDLINYVFSNLDSMDKAIRNQASINHATFVVAVMSSMCLYVQSKQIKQLKRDVEALKKKKGENEE